MRSTNILIFLVLLNAAAGVVGSVAPAQVSPSAGSSDVIQTAQGQVVERETNQPTTEEITGSFFGVGKLIQSIDSVIFAGPNMLRRLGMPGLLVAGFKTAVAFIAAFDVAEAVTGRQLS